MSVKKKIVKGEYRNRLYKMTKQFIEVENT